MNAQTQVNIIKIKMSIFILLRLVKHLKIDMFMLVRLRRNKHVNMFSVTYTAFLEGNQTFH